MQTIHRSVAAGAVLVAGFAAGCAAPARHPSPEPVVPVTASDAVITPEALELAEQARRDVEQLQGLTKKAADADGRQGAATVRRPPEIQWIRPGRARPASPRSATPGSGVQTPLAHDQTPAAVAALPPSGTMKADDEVEPVSLKTDRLRQLVVDLSGELYRRAAYSEMPLRELLLIAATTMVTPDRPLSPEALPGLTDRERELLGRMQAYYMALGQELAESGDPLHIF